MASTEILHCDHHAAGRCASCSCLQQPLATQLAGKQAMAAALFDGTGAAALAPFGSALSGFRNKAKMAVAGRPGHISLGLYGLQQRPLDLCDCPLYPTAMQDALAQIRSWLEALQVPPYDIQRRSGELKFALLTRASPNAALQLRLVLRSETWIQRIAATLPGWQAQLPELRVLSANLQPLPAAILEGEREQLLSSERWLQVPINDWRLCFGTRSFLQTNPAVAAGLYAQAAEWINELAPARVWDLYCGVGGFAFHASAANRRVEGVELSDEAIAAANESLRQARLNPALAARCAGLRFRQGDATAILPALDGADLAIVNPPRRGLGPALCQALEGSECRWLLYSSCQLDSLARDLRRLPGFRPLRWRVFDMFPHVAHFETLVLLQRH